MLFFLSISTLALLLSRLYRTAQGVQLPKPQGPFEIGTTTFQLTDTSRLDPFAPTPQNRSIQISLFYPTSNDSSSLPFSLYLPTLTANDLATALRTATDIFQNISTHAHLDAPLLGDGQNIPIILFSPGMGITRFFYTTFVQGLASEGYIVVSIDHPYDASIVELSDGRVIAANISDSTLNDLLSLNTRVADARFVLDSLTTMSNIVLPNSSSSSKSGLDASRVGFFGHSIGGATAATTTVLDDRVVAGINIDGSFFGPDIQRGTYKPFMLIGQKAQNRTTDAGWGGVWEKLCGFKRGIEVEGALHMTFSDGPILSQLFGLKVETVFGTIEGQRFERIQHAYLKAYFDFALKGREVNLLDGPSKDFPEVLFDSEGISSLH